MTFTTTDRPVEALHSRQQTPLTGPTGDSLGAAEARWNDYAGTAAADEADPVLNSRSIYQIAGLDRDRWSVVGIDLIFGGASPGVVLYAEDRWSDPERLLGRGELTVTAFNLGPSVPVVEFLREAFQEVTVRLVSSLAADHELRVADHAGRPQLAD